MIRSTASFFILASFVLLSSLALSPSASADWSDNFNGGLQQSWQFGSVDGAGNPSATFTGGATGDQLVMSDTNAAAAGGAGAGFGVVISETFTDVRMSGVVNPNGDAATAGTLRLLARGNLLTAQFYAAEINYTSGDLIIFRNDNLATATNLVSAPIAGLTSSQSLLVDFSIIGDTLKARAFDASGGQLLASVSATDSTHAGGLSGVLANANDFSLPMLGVWDDVSASVVPEPTTSLMLITAIGAALSARRRQSAH